MVMVMISLMMQAEEGAAKGKREEQGAKQGTHAKVR
jgi:hypothetical protein